jgi:hypothetical protein
MKRKELIRAVRRVIRDNPSRHDQTRLITNVFDSWGELEGEDVPLADLRKYASIPVPSVPEDPAHPLCGTTACVAGWTVILGSEKTIRLEGWTDTLSGGADIWVKASEMLKLTEDQANYLFAGGRSREEVLDMLDGLLEDRDYLPVDEEAW